ncbi:ABC transporter substrate-binding protein [Rhizobiales bacterium L72]|uniref:Thiamine pyrimidine synthase n=2 Tax=Propylenella binzhouense TaxID=2555902 RepID=A0A964T754_9HYPH|nr:ABC transporter substrate-binding protein [Propylenella binzhouense]
MLALAVIAATIVSARAAEVNFITDFGFNGRHAYYYVALDKGYYKDEGLDVTILRGQGSADAIKKVASGAATLGFADAGSLVLARGNDGVPVKLVAIVYAQPPQAVFALAGGDIKSPKDLEGKTIADTAFSANRLLFPAYAKAVGVDPDKVSWVTADGAALPTMLATGRVEAIGQFTVGEPLLAAVTAPKTLVRFGYKDALSYYGNGIIATDATIAENPDLVKAFVRATLKGMRDAFADPAAAGAIMAKYQKQVDPAVAEGETKLVAELAEVPGRPLGAIDPERVANTIKVVAENMKLNAAVAPEDLYAPGFVE